MKKLYKVDANGVFLEEVLFEDNEIVSSRQYVETPIPQGLYLPAKFNFVNNEWETTLTPEQIKSKTPEPSPSIEEQMKVLQQAVDDLILGGMM